MDKSVLIIGAGVIGLACGMQLSRCGYRVFVVEKENTYGSETSSRSSGVIHAGIYYPKNSMKALMCVRGKNLLYRYCSDFGIKHSKVGKLIVATNANQSVTLKKLKVRAAANGIDLSLLSGLEARRIEPELYAELALFSPTTGIVDTSELMMSLLEQCEANGAELVLSTRIDQVQQVEDKVLVSGISANDIFEAEFDYVVNAAGLFSVNLARQYWADAPMPMKKYAKGNYFKISGKAPFTHLIYPVPEPGGLGIHYTVDAYGISHLGPNVEWVSEIGYHVDPNLENIFRDAVAQYWPAVSDCKLLPGYAGIRPKVIGDDFVIQKRKNIISLVGIESPGITSSLAIAEFVNKLI